MKVDKETYHIAKIKVKKARESSMTAWETYCDTVKILNDAEKKLSSIWIEDWKMNETT